MIGDLLPRGSRKLIVAQNTLVQILGKIIGAGTTFLLSLVIARQFGADGYGDFVKVTTYVAFFFLIADFGLNAIYLQKPKDSWGALVGLRVIGSLGLIFFALALLSFLPHGTSQGYTAVVRFGIILFLPVIFFQALITTANAVFQRELRYVHATIAIACGSAVTLLVLWIGSRVGFSSAVTSGILSLSLGSIVTALVAIGLVRKFQTVAISFSPKIIRQLFVPAIPLGLTLVFNLVYGHVDSIILTLTRATTEVGIYGLAYRVFEVSLVIPTFFMNAVYPLLLKTKNAELHTQNQEFKSIVRQSFFFLIFSSLFVVLCLWFAAPLLTLIKDDFSQSIHALRVLSLGLPFFFLSALTMWTLIALGKQWTLLGIYAASMIVNIALNVWLIPRFGYMAAAWVTTISEGVVLFVSVYVLFRSLSVAKRK